MEYRLKNQIKEIDILEMYKDFKNEYEKWVKEVKGE